MSKDDQAEARPSLPWPYCVGTPELQDRVRKAKLLAVGAGGIGCELLKTLVLTGFQHIDVVDLDTIETSNLNRQFLFRRRHVGHSKAAVAAQAVALLRPDARITAYQANIKEPRFDADFFSGFDLVLNGLDNLEARRHVNRLALAARVPLIESGTAGLLGQVSVHVGGKTECFECQPKPAPKSYPVCTIRNTPDKPVHCVVWAKDLLFARLFGGANGATDLDEGAAGEGGEAGQEGDAEEAAAAAAAYERAEGESAADYAARIFKRAFCSDIEALLRVEGMWEGRTPPTPLDPAALLPRNGAAEPAALLDDAAASARRALGLSDDHAVWTPAQSAAVFVGAARRLLERAPAGAGGLAFDKDDALALEFVTAAANLRGACYAIPAQSLFDAKGMAGNIIHAVATTNAVVSGLMAVEALKLLSGNLEACRTTYMLAQPSNRRLLMPVAHLPPSAGCLVCGTAQARLEVDTSAVTLGQLVEQVLKRQLALVEPTLECGAFMYEEGEGLEEDEVKAYAAQLPKPLAELPGGGIRHGALVEVSDQGQHFRARLLVAHREGGWGDAAPSERAALVGALPEPAAEPAAGPAAGPAEERRAAHRAHAREDTSGAIVLDDSDAEEAGRPGKRRGGGGAACDGAAPAAKRARGGGAGPSADSGEVVILDD